MLKGKVVLVGVTGGIAAYKMVDLVSRLKKLGADVFVVMTEAATRFVTPLVMRTISQNPVSIDTFAETSTGPVQHIDLAQRADVVLIAPATANIVGKIAHGIADNLLSTLVMATRAPVLIAPSMNVNMYENPIFQENLARLRRLGFQIIEPASGHLACGDTGKGRLPEPEVIIEAILTTLHVKQDLRGKTVLVTAGATREALDPVRFITNHSTGKMGYALAEAARDRGARVILVSGPTNLAPPANVTFIPVTSAIEMYEAVMKHFPTSHIVVKAAAVADYRPKRRAEQKIKKGEGNLIIELERNPDILYELGKRKEHQILVGFAAESENVIEYAKNKIQQKNLDLIVANDITQTGAGFGEETNIVTLISANGLMVDLPKLSKYEVAHRIFDAVTELI
ncbi:MAG: bifunctional phosphopantothenoylcysteine decarboxylase/phosphopantothenate--cysteine ligase CoaBC [Firmicutes bacterium]|nr:bifunctional phosphopantothenoylcysteine decarboxylase/phosphopantothenate--cysteine ligase CoaBC [Bacillota bacterium]